METRRNRYVAKRGLTATWRNSEVAMCYVRNGPCSMRLRPHKALDKQSDPDSNC